MKLRSQGIKKFLPAFFLAILTLAVFRAWFTVGAITSGDFGFHFEPSLNELFSFPHLWDGQHIALLFLYPPIFLTGLLSKLGLGFALVERLVWFWPFLILTIFSSWYLAKIFFPKNVFWFFCPFVFLFNTYILMVVGGGQVGIAMAYALAPLVLGLFINLINELKSSRVNEFKKLVLAGTVLAVQVMWDPRIAYITMGGAGLYWIINLLFINGLTSFKIALRSLFYTFVVPGLIAAGLHFYWLLPVILVRRAALPAGYGEPGWVEFLSFADFSNSFSLLHPNWPENIFGKTYFMRPEFLILPILAFSSLLFINQLTSSRVKELNNSLINNSLITNKIILYFNLLALIGAFLAKGSKPPFGGVYLWLFKYFPGMNMFRDPTKFYVLVALSYSILIPFTLEQVSKKFNKKLGAWCLVLGAFLIYWLFLIRPTWLGQIGGTFKAKEVPQEYVVLKDFIHNQEGFFRTFWVPKGQRFGFYSNNHPAIESSELLSEEELAVMGVKYVIIPFDSEGEIFLKDRKYDHQQRLALEQELDKISWLKKIELTDKIAVYETPEHKDHFFIDLLSSSRVNELTSWQMINPTKYLVSLKISQPPATLVFSETYDELWQAKIREKIIPSTMYNNINSFTIDQTGDFDITVEFAAQKYVYLGGIVSFITLLLSLGGLVCFGRRKRVRRKMISSKEVF